MNNWSVEKIQEFYTYLNEYFELSVNPEIEIGEKIDSRYNGIMEKFYSYRHSLMMKVLMTM